MPVFLDDAHSILRQPALIYANGIAIPSFLNSEHSMVLYPRLYIASRFFPNRRRSGRHTVADWVERRGYEGPLTTHPIQPLQPDARLHCRSLRRNFGNAVTSRKARWWRRPSSSK